MLTGLLSWLVRRLIRQGNDARGKDWPRAARAYGRALRLAPGLDGIWIQQGHALAESGVLPDAIRAYAEASRLQPAHSEPLVLLGEIAKRLRAFDLAAQLHLMALARADAAPDQRHLFVNVSVAGEVVDNDTMREVAERSRLEPILDALFHKPSDPPTGPPRLILDVSDLVYHLAGHATLSGIQRVQACVLATLDEMVGPNGWMACVFAPRRSEWVEVEPMELASLLAVALEAGHSDAVARRSSFFGTLSTRPKASMPPGSTLANLGSSWLLEGYSTAVALLKKKRGVAFRPFVHDLIPLVLPELSDRRTREAFAQWVAELASLADGCFVNSQATKIDLVRIAAKEGAPLSPDRIEVVRLDAHFGGAADHEPAPDDGFALVVSTFERRKNHRLLFEAWSLLVRAHGDAVPTLICVGRVTDDTDAILADLCGRPELAGRVQIRHDVADSELDRLYVSCRFTVYPSMYEGWGLPVSEALSHGRVPVVARNSALVEAGAELALFFDTGSAEALAAAVAKVAFDADWRAERERLITHEHRTRSWADIARQITRACALNPKGA